MIEMAKRKSTPIVGDGWNDTAAEAESRIIRGSLLKFSDAGTGSSARRTRPSRKAASSWPRPPPPLG